MLYGWHTYFYFTIILLVRQRKHIDNLMTSKQIFMYKQTEKQTVLSQFAFLPNYIGLINP